MQFIEWLKGKKTYIIAAGGIITAVGAYLNGSISLTDLVFAIFSASGITALRGGIAKATPLIVSGLTAISLFGLTSCDTTSAFLAKLSPSQKAAVSQLASNAVTIGTNVINAATSLGIATIANKIPQSDNPYLASAAVGLRTLQGTPLVTTAQVQDVIATFGDPNAADKFSALGTKLGGILTDYGAKPITDATLEAAATALNQLNDAAGKMQDKAGTP